MNINTTIKLVVTYIFFLFPYICFFGEWISMYKSEFSETKCICLENEILFLLYVRVLEISLDVLGIKSSLLTVHRAI